MQALSNFLNRIANWKSLLFFLALYLFFNAYLLKNAGAKITELAGKEVGIIDLTFGYDPDRTLQMVEDYGDAARAYYARTEMTLDVAYPIVYAFFFGIVLSLLYHDKRLAWAIRLPFVTMLLDFSENIYIILLLKHYPEQDAFLAAILEVLKMVKWLLFGIIILLVVGGVVGKLFKRGKVMLW